MSTPERKGSYKRVADRVEEGDLSFMVEPLDFLLLEALPDFNTNVGGLYQIGETVSSLRKKFKVDGKLLDSSVFSSRLRAMDVGGLCRSITLVSGRGSHGWQKTELGKEIVVKWRKEQQPSEPQ